MVPVGLLRSGRTKVEKRIVQLDGIRALAISAVFVHHALKVKLLWMGVDLSCKSQLYRISGPPNSASRGSALPTRKSLDSLARLGYYIGLRNSILALP